MSLPEFKKLGLALAYPKNTWAQRLPEIQDVLYILRLTEEQRSFTSFQGVNPAYIRNTLLVAAAVSDVIYNAYQKDPEHARKIIATTIVELAPEEACCLRNQDFAAARAVLDPTLENKAQEEMVDVCECEKCGNLRQIAACGLACGD